MRSARIPRLDLANSTNLFKYLISFLSLDNRRRNPIKLDYFTANRENIERKVTENEVTELITGMDPTVEDLLKILDLVISKTTNNIAALERNINEAFEGKRDIENRIKNDLNTDSIHQAIMGFCNDLKDVLIILVSKKDLGETLIATYNNAENLFNKSSSTPVDLELGKITKKEAVATCKLALDSQSNLVDLINEFFREEFDDPDLLRARSALIGVNRSLRENFRVGIEEIERKNVAVFNIITENVITVSQIPELQQKEATIIEALRNSRTFVDEDHNQKVQLENEQRVMKNMISELLEDIGHLETSDIDLANIEVMKNSVEGLERQLTVVLKLDPDVVKRQEEITYMMNEEEIAETFVIGNIIKKIKYEILRKERELKNAEKEEINKAKTIQNLEKGLPRENLPELRSPKMALVWMHEVKRLADKFKEDKSMEGRFATLLRNSLKVEADKLRAVTCIDPLEIVKLVKNKYIDSGQAVNSCLEEVMKRSTPKNLQESITALEITNSQLKLFKSLGYLQLLNNALLDLLATKVFRSEDMEDYLVKLKIRQKEEKSFKTSSPERGAESSLHIIAGDGDDRMKDDIEVMREFFMEYSEEKLDTLKSIQGSFQRANIFRKANNNGEKFKNKFKNTSTMFATIEEEEESDDELACVATDGKKKDLKKLNYKPCPISCDAKTHLFGSLAFCSNFKKKDIDERKEVVKKLNNPKNSFCMSCLRKTKHIEPCK